MQQRRLGRGGEPVSVLGLGTWPIGGGMGHVDENTAIATIRTAIDGGITLVDTAQAYRISESFIGKALRDGYRERCYLATKVSGDYSRHGIISALESSLRALDVEMIDLYQIHGWDSKYPLDESMGTMLQLQREGKTRHIGVSNYNAQQMRQALQIGSFQSTQPQYNLFDRQIEIEDIAFCEQEEIGILAHSPLAKGLLTGKYGADYRFPEEDERSGMGRFQGKTFAHYLALADRLQAIARDKGISLVQLAIAWQLRLPAITCVLVGAKNPDQVTDHMKAAAITFSHDELARIDQVLEE